MTVILNLSQSVGARSETKNSSEAALYCYRRANGSADRELKLHNFLYGCDATEHTTQDFAGCTFACYS